MLSIKSFIENDWMKTPLLKGSNRFKEKEHEEHFTKGLKELGFVEVDSKSDLGVEIRSQDSLTFISELLGKFLFIEQAFGSQNPPDFILVIDGMVLYVELKSSVAKKILWNTGFPRNNCLYIFDTPKLGRVMFFGQDHFYGDSKDANYKLYKETVNAVRVISKEKFRDTIFDPKNHHPGRKTFPYMRPMLPDIGDDGKGTYDISNLYRKVLDKVNKAIKIEL